MFESSKDEYAFAKEFLKILKGRGIERSRRKSLLKITVDGFDFAYAAVKEKLDSLSASKEQFNEMLLFVVKRVYERELPKVFKSMDEEGETESNLRELGNQIGAVFSVIELGIISTNFDLRWGTNSANISAIL